MPKDVTIPKDLKMPKSGRCEKGGTSRPSSSHGDGEASGSARVSTSSPAATPRAKALQEKHSGYARLLQVEEKPLPTRLASPVLGDARSASCFFKAPPCSIPAKPKRARLTRGHGAKSRDKKVNQKAASSSRLRSRPTLLSRVRAAERERVGRRAKSSPSPLPRRPRGPAVAGRRSLLPPHPPPYPPPPHRLPQPLPLPPHSAAASAAAVFLRPRRPRRPRRALQRARSHAQVGKTSGAHAHAAPEGRLFGTGGRPAQPCTWHSGKTLQEKNFTRKPW